MNNILLSTTASITGYTITKHVGIVTEHVVIGADLIANFLASFTDLVGGRSKSLEQKISTLKNDLLLEMTHTAHAVYANALIDLHVDFDEISGKNTQLFMVTGIATAVVVEQLPDSLNRGMVGSSDNVNGCRVQRRLEIEALTACISEFKSELTKEGGGILDTEKLGLMISTSLRQNATSLITPLLEIILLIPAHFPMSDVLGQSLSDVSRLLNALSGEQAYAALTDAFMAARECGGTRFDDAFLGTDCADTVAHSKEFAEALPVDYKAMGQMFSAIPCCYWEIFILPLVYKYKDTYSLSDIEHINALTATISALMAHPAQQCSISKASGILGQNTWTCVCGTTQSAKRNICGTCGRDIYGLSDSARSSVAVAIEHLTLICASVQDMLDANTVS